MISRRSAASTATCLGCARPRLGRTGCRATWMGTRSRSSGEAAVVDRRIAHPPFVGLYVAGLAFRHAGNFPTSADHRQCGAEHVTGGSHVAVSATAAPLFEV